MRILVGVLAERNKMLPVIFVPHVSVYCRLLSRIFFLAREMLVWFGLVVQVEPFLLAALNSCGFDKEYSV
jgi:hypothetical protein